MSPTQFTKRDMNGLCPSPLKLTRDSHFIKKSPPTSSSSSKSSLVNPGMATTKPQPRHPVIIYTHSPKIIHTHPRDFMALVQKLTGLTRSEDDTAADHQAMAKPGKDRWKQDDHTTTSSTHVSNDDSESSSVITDEIGSSVGDVQVNSSPVVPPLFDPPNPCFNNIPPVFGKNPNDFLCSNQPPFYNYTDSLFLMPNMRNSLSFSSTLEDIKECREF
ncbi:VQ motif-containing protein 20-like [Cornus florida]|uniref:VQ motif-containing protein 20-like n=1 Tax=Cornus florida TaxID=4283 RepID=UPI00289F16CF|nr:VQ motif-containing protein 20-like [Cornus florida]